MSDIRWRLDLAWKNYLAKSLTNNPHYMFKYDEIYYFVDFESSFETSRSFRLEAKADGYAERYPSACCGSFRVSDKTAERPRLCKIEILARFHPGYSKRVVGERDDATLLVIDGDSSPT